MFNAKHPFTNPKLDWESQNRELEADLTDRLGDLDHPFHESLLKCCTGIAKFKHVVYPEQLNAVYTLILELLDEVDGLGEELQNHWEQGELVDEVDEAEFEKPLPPIKRVKIEEPVCPPTPLPNSGPVNPFV